MKKILILLLLCLSIPSLPARELNKQWREYQRLSRRDRPRDQIAKLHEIRSIALDRRFPDDFYDACLEEERIYSRLNWKSADSLHLALKDAFDSYGEPLLTYRWLNWHSESDEDWEYALAHKEELSAGRHPSLQSVRIPFLQSDDQDDIANDFEWILWSRLRPFNLLDTDSKEYRLLDEMIGDRYPARPYLSYLGANRSEDRLSAMQALSEQYADTPFHFLPDHAILEERMNRLSKDNNATEADAKALYNDVNAFAKAIRAEKNFARRVDLSVDRIRDNLEDPVLGINFQNDSIIITGRNIGRGAIVFQSDQYRRSVYFRNREGPFYIKDSLAAPIPDLPDGSYHVYSEKYWSSSNYQKHTLSMAVRQLGDDFAVYVTDYQTGEPVPYATIRLTYGSSIFRRKNYLERIIPLDGFTPLPADFQKQIGKKTSTLEAWFGDRRSPAIPVYKTENALEPTPDLLHARVFKDRGAYQPGDTLKAKVVLFEGDLSNQVKTIREGRDVQVRIFNAERKSLADLKLRTNSYGSVACEWPIPPDERNGIWSIEVSYQKKTLTRSSFRVEDFVPPSFEVTFDPQEDPFLPNEDFFIKGKAASYSGHPVDGITMEGTATRYGREAWKGTVVIERDGSFRIPLNLSQGGEYLLNLHAVDATGETRSFEHHFTVTANLSFSVELDNATDGEFSIRNSSPGKVLTEDIGLFSWTIKNGNQAVKLPIAYKLLNENGKAIKEGTSDDTLELDMSDCPDGLYFLQGIIKYGQSDSRAIMSFLKWTAPDILDAPVRSVFLPGETDVEQGETICARLGAGDGPLWTVVSLTAPDGSILESRPVYLDGVKGRSGSLSELVFSYKENYPDIVRLEVFYFRDAEQIVHEAVYHRIRHKLELPLSFSRFVDQTMPGSSCTLSLQTEPDVEAVVAVYDKSIDVISPNVWNNVTLLQPEIRDPWTRLAAGSITGERPGFSFSGNGPVYGIVIDQDGLPIIGSSVYVENNPAEGTVTDMDGQFSLQVPVGTPLQVSSIGYNSVIVPAGPGMRIVLDEDMLLLEETVVIGYGVQKKNPLEGFVSGKTTREISSDMDRKRNKERASVAELIGEGEDMPYFSDEIYRELFSEALAFQPFLHADDTGMIEVCFQTSDKLSTYHVNVFAHDRSMRNAVLQRDLVVTIPVRISATPPRYLYERDLYELSAVVSSITDQPVTGRLFLQTEEGEDQKTVQMAEMNVPAGGSASALFTIAAPVPMIADSTLLNLRLVFEGDTFTDAVRYSIPVFRASQPLIESHSAMAGMDAVDSLRRAFVNIPGEQAEVSVRTLREIAEAGLAQWTAPDGPDALSLSANFYARILLGQDTTGTLEPLLALRNEDGGFAWTEGMESSPVVTATLLERFATLRDRGYSIPDMEASVHYLDNSQFGNWMPMWCGGLSDEEYMDIRAMWTPVPFDLKGIEEKTVRRFRLRDFRRFARAYLSPGRYDYANGWILDKARRVRTLQNLTSSDEGIALGEAWGEILFTALRFQNTISNDLISLEQYAVTHPSGGMYYPNAVLPFRGLLSSEVYAHTLIANLLYGQVPNGVRLWLVLQNETQSWTDDPAYVDALQSILAAPDSLLDRQIVTLTASDVIPFKDIQASGNGMRIDRNFYLEKNGDRTEVQPGDTLQVGDRLIACYVLWSKENRSFVRINAFREANLMPVEQRSGPASVAIGPIRIDGLWTKLAQCYRDVRADRTSWWIDVCPEENSIWEESFFVTQAGTFTAPVVTVESLYAPQYRANGFYQSPLTSQ